MKNISTIMKTKYHFAFFASLMLIGWLWAFTGCSILEDAEYIKAIKEPLKSPINTRNPFDFVGVEHNRGLEYLGQFSDSIIDLVVIQKDTQGVAELTARKLTEFYGTNVNLDFIGLQLDNSALDSYLSQEPFDLIDSLPIASNSRQRLLNLLANINAHSMESTKDINEIMNLVMAMEDQVSADTMLANEDRAILLSGTSVFRHSIFFWSSLLYDDSLPWSKIIHQTEAANPRKTSVAYVDKGVKIAKADLLGALAGSVWGPWGSVAVGALFSAEKAYDLNRPKSY